MSSTVVLGAGIIGVSTAYYLSQHQAPSTIVLVEPSRELFASASGYAGGFVAKDWYGPPVASLGALSFEEHRSLAKENDGPERWGYAASAALSYTVASRPLRSSRRGDDWLQEGSSRVEVAVAAIDATSGETPGWLRRTSGDQAEVISEEGTTAQV
jgi:glycine/D-amino acid oxidase-like deaminating enzyme